MAHKQGWYAEELELKDWDDYPDLCRAQGCREVVRFRWMENLCAKHFGQQRRSLTVPRKTRCGE